MFSLGATFYALLTLRPLFKVDNKELLVKNRECILNL